MVRREHHAFLEAFLLHVKFWSATWTKDSCDLRQVQTALMGVV